MECITSGPMGSWPIVIITTAVGYALGRVRPIKSIRARWRWRRQIRLIYDAGRFHDGNHFSIRHLGRRR